MIKIRRQELEIFLSRSIDPFSNPRVGLEQYLTPPRVAANLLFRAMELGDISGKTVIDICAGTGMLGIGASLLNAEVTTLEIDEVAINIQKQNIEKNDLLINILHQNLFEYATENKFDTVLSNPPFGIQQKRYKDLDFVQKGLELADIGYFILDGSKSNIDKIPKLLEKRGIELLEFYIDEFPINHSYTWHTLKRKINKVMVIRVR